jgi:hypothetical protein
LAERLDAIDVAPLRARADAARARVMAATGDLDAAVGTLEATVDRLDAGQVPWLRATLLLELARLREAAGDAVGAGIDATAASAILSKLDVVAAAEDLALIERLGRSGRAAEAAIAELVQDGKWWTASSGGASVRLPDTKGLRYLAMLLVQPGVERHALDLVDREEGVAVAGGIDRRTLGDAGPVLDGRARVAYRRRIEELRADADEALAAGRLDDAEACQAEIDQLVSQLAQAFGLGGRHRPAASAAERARLNVTRALRAAIARLTDALPTAGAVLDRRVRTGTYCAYVPDDSDPVRWIVQSAVNGTRTR